MAAATGAGRRAARVGTGLAEWAFPARTAGAGEGVKEIAAGASVQAGRGDTHGRAVAAWARGRGPGPGQEVLSGARGCAGPWARQGQREAAERHAAQAACEVLGQQHPRGAGAAQEAQVSGQAAQGHGRCRAVQPQQPTRCAGLRALHGQAHAVPSAVGYMRPGRRQHCPWLAAAAAHAGCQRAVVHGQPDRSLYARDGAQQPGLGVARAEGQREVADRAPGRRVVPAEGGRGTLSERGFSHTCGKKSIREWPTGTHPLHKPAGDTICGPYTSSPPQVGDTHPPKS